MRRSRSTVAPLLALALGVSACGMLIGINDLTRGDALDGPEGGALGEGGAGGSDAVSATDAPLTDAPVSDAPTGCGDTNTSKEHCGRCNHSCLGGDCAGGVCQPFAIASNQGEVAAIALDATHAYFTSWTNDFVARVPKTGGAVQPIANVNVKRARRIAVDAIHVYWANDDFGGNALVARCPTTGCSAAPEIVAQPQEPKGLALDATHVYWADRNAQVIRRRPLVAGASELVATTPDLPWSVVVDGAQVFFTQDFSGQVHRTNDPPDGGVVLIGANGQSGRELVVDSTFVYWGAAVDPGEVGKISRAPRTGGGPVTLVTGAQGEPMGMAIDGTTLYWTAIRKPASGPVQSAGVYSCPTTGCGVPTTLATQDLPRGIAVDSDAIYWGANGVVMKLAK